MQNDLKKKKNLLDSVLTLKRNQNKCLFLQGVWRGHIKPKEGHKKYWLKFSVK